ncbi:MAG: beta-lactamase family protein [Butyrivibrio sp.]|nr:beta-lactamase family protein [Butyrivibrio sp.]
MKVKYAKMARKALLSVLAAAIVLMQGLAMPNLSMTRVYAAEESFPSGIAYSDLGMEIEKYVVEHEDTTAGMEVSVFSGYETVYTNYFGYADKEAGLKVDKDTVMEWGSTSKLLTWVSVMQLWEQGKIDLDADIKEYLPEEFLTNLNYDTPVTMTNLMNHNAGYQEVYADLFLKEHDALLPLEDALKAHMPEQIYEPGTVTAYSNWGVALAAYIVERISGIEFDDYVHQNIFEPLGMEDSALSADLSDNSLVARKRSELQCYTIDGDLIPDCFYYISLYPAGMCTSTLEDFEKFGKALLDENSPLFEKSETWQTLFTPTAYLGDSGVPSNCHGFWMPAYGVQTVGHGGNTAGCSSYLLLDLQDNIGVVVMTNQANEEVYNYDMMELIFGEYSAKDYFDGNQGEPDGIYTSARTCRKGPFKVLSLSYTDAADLYGIWAVGTSGGIDKVCCPYGDYVRVSLGRFILESASFFLWIAALIFSAISIIIKLIKKVVYIIKKKDTAIPLGRWSTLAALLQIAAALLVMIMAIGASSYASAASYTWANAAFIPLMIVMVAVVIYGIVALCKMQSGKLRKLYNIITLVMIAVTITDILYWNLFMFWKM